MSDPRIERALSLLKRALTANALGDRQEERDLIVEALAVIADVAAD